MAGMTEDDSLIPMPRERRVYGPVYQGVAKQIRTLEQAEIINADEHAGTIAQARSLAASIDRVSGHTHPKGQASGMQLAALHNELDQLLARLRPDDAGGDPFAAMLDKMNEQEANERARAAAAAAPDAQLDEVLD